MTPTETYFNPDKEQEFRLYVIWKSLPRDIDKTLFGKLGVTDDLILELSDIKTQKQFSQKYKVDVNTLSDWNKEIIAGNLAPELKELDWRYWAKQTTPVVASAVLRRIRKLGDPAAATWWMKHIEGYEEKSRHALTDGDGNSFIGGLADLIIRAEQVLEDNGETV